MTEQQCRIIADRAKGDDPQVTDVQVTVSLIEEMRGYFRAGGDSFSQRMATSLTALLSQPNPTAEPEGVEVNYTLSDDVESTAVVTIDGDVATGRDKYMPDYRVKLFRTEHGWDARKPTIEPPRIEDMAPVATHSSGEHRRVRLGEGDDLPVCDTCTNVLGLNVRWDHAVQRHERDGIDPSTIRDVQPPASGPTP